MPKVGNNFIMFLGSIAPLQSAIQVHSDGGVSVKVDIPESHMEAAVKLMGMRQKILRITVEVVDNNDRTDT